MWPLCERPCLTEHVHAPHDERAPDVERRTQRPELLGELAGKLPGGCDYEGEDAVGVLGEAVEDGECKGCGLAAASLGDAEHIVACKDPRDAAALHGGGALHAELAAGVDGPLGESEISEGVIAVGLGVAAIDVAAGGIRAMGTEGWWRGFGLPGRGGEEAEGLGLR